MDVLSELRGTIADLKVRQTRLTAEEARETIARADAWIDGLGPRRYQPGFEEEYREVAEALEQLRALYAEIFKCRVLALSVPQALSKKHRQLSQSAMFANVAAAVDPRTRAGIADPDYIRAERSVKPSVEVELVGQGWVQHARLKYRARVRDLWAIIVNGKRGAIGSRRYCMMQAHWVLMCDPSGHLPAIETMTGLAKRRTLHKIRRDKRKREAAAAYVRLLRRRAPKSLTPTYHNRAPNQYKGPHGDRRRKALVRAGKLKVFTGRASS